jgi:tetratricopeptide (TPR) repeat protein
MPSVRLGLVPVLAVSLAAGAANAEPAADAKSRAEAKAAEAERLYDAGQFQASLDRLTEAFALYASPRLHYDFGLVYRGLGRDADAYAAFERFLAETNERDADVYARRKEAAWHLEGLRTRLGAGEAKPAEKAPPKLYRRAWFWAAGAALVAAAVTAAAILSRNGQPAGGVCAGACELGEWHIDVGSTK